VASMKLSKADITGVLGMLPTPSTPDADRWDCENSVDLDESARMVAMIATAGVKILLTNGSFGEGATLTATEQRDFTACIAETLSGKGLLFAGVTTLNTRETIARARLLLDAGADGLFLGRPMWMSLDQPGIVRYYADVAEALPGVPLIIYDNEFAFKAKIATDTYAALSRNAAIVATKHIGGPAIGDDLRAVEGRMRVLPVDARWLSLAQSFADEATACWSGNVADGPEVLALLAHTIARRDWPLAADLSERMAWAQAPMFPGGKLENFIDYNIPIAHARLEGSGRVRSGPPRPPYLDAPADHIEGGRETGRRWASLRETFATALASTDALPHTEPRAADTGKAAAAG
jgi:4-(2-carboxyphenyl)-2-oxobut-3-enoate aldolase